MTAQDDIARLQRELDETRHRWARSDMAQMEAHIKGADHELKLRDEKIARLEHELIEARAGADRYHAIAQVELQGQVARLKRHRMRLRGAIIRTVMLISQLDGIPPGTKEVVDLCVEDLRTVLSETTDGR